MSSNCDATCRLHSLFTFCLSASGLCWTKNGVGKGASMGDILSWPSTSVQGKVAHVLDACGPLCEYGDILKTLVGLIFEELCITHYGKKKK